MAKTLSAGAHDAETPVNRADRAGRLQTNRCASHTVVDSSPAFEHYKFVILPTSFRQNFLLILFSAIKNTTLNIMLLEWQS